MDRSFFSLSASPVRRQILYNPQDITFLRGCFLIDFNFTHIISPREHDATNNLSDFTITINKVLAIPIEILCNCMHAVHNTVVYDIFSFLPTNILHMILPHMEECARQMVARNNEGRDILEMNMSLHVDTISAVNMSHTAMVEEEEDDYISPDDNGQQVQQIVGLLENLENNCPSRNFGEQCSICLEEFCSKSELAYTKCSHVFHKECIVPWIQECVNNSSSYSCPLCRSQII